MYILTFVSGMFLISYCKYKDFYSVLWYNDMGIIIMRYLGNKTKLLNFIDKVIDKYNIEGTIFADLFAGTGCVGDFFKDKYKIISNDFLYYSYILNIAKLQNPKKPSFTKFRKKFGIDIYNWLNNLKFKPNKSFFFYYNYTPKGNRMFFTEKMVLK